METKVLTIKLEIFDGTLISDLAQVLDETFNENDIDCKYEITDIYTK